MLRSNATSQGNLTFRSADKLLDWPRQALSATSAIRSDFYYPSTLSPSCVSLGNCRKVGCLVESTPCILSGNCRFGNAVLTLVNSLSFSQAVRYWISFSRLVKALPVLNITRVGKDTSRACKPLHTSLYFYRESKRLRCSVCRRNKPGIFWRYGISARKLLVLSSLSVSASKLVIHLRGEDSFERKDSFHPLYVPPPCSWYETLMLQHRFQEAVIVTSQDRNHPCLDWFVEQELPHTVVSSTVVKDFEFMANSVNLAVSTSTFSLAAAYVSETLEQLFVPLMESDNKFLGTLVDLGYAARNIDVHVYLVPDYITVWKKEAISAVTRYKRGQAVYLKTYKV